ncbi:MAG: flagellar basal body P-ring formation chaperone FlgA [Bryobacteraceae bacterium]
MKRISMLLLMATPWLAAACQPVDGDRILGRDLAAANPAFSVIAPEQTIGFAPAPGRRRIFGSQELARLAHRYPGAGSSFAPVCFERVTQPLTAERLVAALKKAVDLPDVEIHVLDFSRYPLPPGELAFSRSSLPAAPPSNPDAGITWRGQLTAAGHHSVPIWVTAQILVERQWIEAAADIPAGKPIAAGQLLTKTGKQFPFAASPLSAIADVTGRTSQRAIRTGQIIFPAMLGDTDAVERGDAVAVHVSSGGAQLQFEARAESSGHRGEIVAVRNPLNGRPFPAVVQSKGKVLVNPYAAQLDSKNPMAGPRSRDTRDAMRGRDQSIQ